MKYFLYVSNSTRWALKKIYIYQLEKHPCEWNIETVFDGQGVLIWQEASLSCIIPPFLLILDLQSYWTRKTFPLLFQAGKPHKKLNFVTYQSCKHVNYLLFSLCSTGNTPKNEDRRDSWRAAGTLSIFWVYTGVFLTNTVCFFYTKAGFIWPEIQ